MSQRALSASASAHVVWHRATVHTVPGLATLRRWSCRLVRSIRAPWGSLEMQRLMLLGVAAASIISSVSADSGGTAGSCGWFGPTGTTVLLPDVWLADASVKIFPTTSAPISDDDVAAEAWSAVPPPPNSHICTARREHMPFQVAVRPSSTLSETRLVARSSDPALSATVSLVINVPVSIPINPENTTGLFPDALPAVPAAGITLEADTTTTFWVSVVSNNSGNYTVSLELESGSGPTAIVGEVDVTVLGFEIPEHSSFMADTGVEFAPLFQWSSTPVDRRTALVKGVYAQLSEYRINRLVACDGVNALVPPTAHVRSRTRSCRPAYSTACRIGSNASRRRSSPAPARPSSSPRPAGRNASQAHISEESVADVAR